MSATHWTSGTASGWLTSTRIRKLHADRGLAATLAEADRNRVVAVGDSVCGVCPLGAEVAFEVVAIERNHDDEGRPAPTGAAVVYLREVPRC